MKTALIISQVIISALLILLVLIQNKEGGLNSVVSGSQTFESTKRGAEKVIFNATVILAALFLINALLFVYVK